MVDPRTEPKINSCTACEKRAAPNSTRKAVTYATETNPPRPTLIDQQEKTTAADKELRKSAKNLVDDFKNWLPKRNGKESATNGGSQSRGKEKNDNCSNDSDSGGGGDSNHSDSDSGSGDSESVNGDSDGDDTTILGNLVQKLIKYHRIKRKSDDGKKLEQILRTEASRITRDGRQAVWVLWYIEMCSQMLRVSKDRTRLETGDSNKEKMERYKRYACHLLNEIVDQLWCSKGESCFVLYEFFAEKNIRITRVSRLDSQSKFVRFVAEGLSRLEFPEGISAPNPAVLIAWLRGPSYREVSKAIGLKNLAQLDMDVEVATCEYKLQQNGVGFAFRAALIPRSEIARFKPINASRIAEGTAVPERPQKRQRREDDHSGGSCRERHPGGASQSLPLLLSPPASQPQRSNHQSPVGVGFSRAGNPTASRPGAAPNDLDESLSDQFGSATFVQSFPHLTTPLATESTSTTQLQPINTSPPGRGEVCHGNSSEVSGQDASHLHLLAAVARQAQDGIERSDPFDANGQGESAPRTDETVAHAADLHALFRTGWSGEPTSSLSVNTTVVSSPPQTRPSPRCRSTVTPEFPNALTRRSSPDKSDADGRRLDGPLINSGQDGEPPAATGSSASSDASPPNESRLPPEEANSHTVPTTSAAESLSWAGMQIQSPDFDVYGHPEPFFFNDAFGLTGPDMDTFGDPESYGNIELFMTP
ncbi:hypothetical protein B0H63DRAFT_520404 [Podospora didyma]|uniref:Uncharacterized protein n=1 Tax=Podospora didyma TaxID=330526 RepID=A0AAE0P0P1_9PEZI|nr:hypothetical protein B0H63DRAFT_520404 [Podospora didyma]